MPDDRVIGCGLGRPAGGGTILDDLHLGAAFACGIGHQGFDFVPHPVFALAGDHAPVEQELAILRHHIVGMATGARVTVRLALPTRSCCGNGFRHDELRSGATGVLP